MPPRKSNISQVSTANEDGGGTPSKEREQLQQQQQQGLNIEVSFTCLLSLGVFYTSRVSATS